MPETQEIVGNDATAAEDALLEVQAGAGGLPEPDEPSGEALATRAQSSEELSGADVGGLAETPTPEGNLALILDVPVHVTAELGRTKLPVNEVLGLTAGSVVEFERHPGEPVDILVNGQRIARGDVVVVNDRFGVCITGLVNSGGAGKGPGVDA